MEDGNIEDPIEIVVDEEIKASDDPVVVEAPEPSKKKIVEPDEGMDLLKQQLERERLARAEAERQAQQYAQTAYYAQSEVQDTNLHLVTNAMETLRQNNEMLKANYQAAMENQDFSAAADIQLAMADNSAKIGQLEAGKQQLEAAPPPRQPVFTPSDPVDAFASQLSARSAAWVRDHPEYVTDPRLNSKMLAAHNLVVADDIAPDTDEYFSAVERILGVGESAPRSTSRRSAPPAAPVSRSGTGAGSNPNVVHLTAAQREAAQLSGMTDQEYAKSLLALKREGRLN